MPPADDQRPGVFISYRREDAPAHAGRLYDRLAERFGEARVFMDVDSIGLGLDWLHVLRHAVESCEVMLVLIGPGWLDARTRDGVRRLDEPDDYVRLEVETALDRGIRVVPVLVHGAMLPDTGSLPEPLRRLVRRQALELGDATFRTDASLLLERLEQALADSPPSPVRAVEAQPAPIRTAEPKPATPPAREPGVRPWTVRPEPAGRNRRRLIVTSPRSVHTIEYVLRMLRGNELRLDGAVVGTTGVLDAITSADVLSERYEFPIADGDEVHDGVIEVKLSNVSIEGFVLEIDGRRLHGEP